MSFGINESLTFKPVTIAILIISDSRTLETDTSGQTLQARITAAGHSVHERKIVTDDIAEIRKTVSAYIDNAEVDVVITSGGTCLLYTSPSPRDQRGSRMPSSA